MRLDLYLVQQGLVESRSKALQLIKGGKVEVDGKIVKKGGYKLSPSSQVRLLEEFRYVSRGAYKLKGAISQFGVDFAGKVVLDVGSSTGGFTQVALEAGAKKVVAVDVGKDQLHPSLRKNPRVELYEETDIRQFDYPGRFEIVVTDVSFIPLTKILPKLAQLGEGEFLLLFKPQFEVGPEVKRNKKGVVTDQKAVEKAMERFEELAREVGLEIVGKMESPILGKDGNREFIYHLRKRVEKGG